MKEGVYLDGKGEVFVDKMFFIVAALSYGDTYEQAVELARKHYRMMSTPCKYRSDYTSDDTLQEYARRRGKAHLIDMKQFALFQMLEKRTYQQQVEEYVNAELDGKLDFGIYKYTSHEDYYQRLGYTPETFERLSKEWNVPVREIMGAERGAYYRKLNFFDIVRDVINMTKTGSQNSKFLFPHEYHDGQAVKNHVSEQAPKAVEVVQQAPPVAQPTRQVATPQQHKPVQQTQVQAPQPRTPQANDMYNRPMEFDGVKAPNFNALCVKIDIDAGEVVALVKQGKNLQTALLETVRKTGIARSGGAKVTLNALYLKGHFYPNLQAACTLLNLNHTEVSYYKSEKKCSARDAVLAHLPNSFFTR